MSFISSFLNQSPTAKQGQLTYNMPWNRQSHYYKVLLNFELPELVFFDACHFFHFQYFVLQCKTSLIHQCNSECQTHQWKHGLNVLRLGRTIFPEHWLKRKGFQGSQSLGSTQLVHSTCNIWDRFWERSRGFSASENGFLRCGIHFFHQWKQAPAVQTREVRHVDLLVSHKALNLIYAACVSTSACF